MAGICWFLSFQVLGYLSSRLLFPTRGKAVRIWLGSVLGSVAAIWLPVPFSFFFRFTPLAQWLSLLTGLLAFSVFIILRKKRPAGISAVVHAPESNDTCPHSILPLLVLLPLFLLLCTVLLLSHTLSPGENGLYTGQCTFGDMCMHLGFITSLAVQGTFPPYYSIFPSAKLCYPFLCDSISASLYVLGTSLRISYIFPMLFALGQVFCGVWFLSADFCRKRGAPVLCCVLFFLNGGFGLFYFLNGEYSFTDLFFGFYKTPTNLTDAGIRWVNVIADMLIPQRATLFGWSVLFACLWLLYRAAFCNDKTLWPVSGCLGGLLPMIHTHSYLALGLIAFMWLLWTLKRDKLSRTWFRNWLLFGVPAVALAVPQLLEWTFRSVNGNAHFLRIGIDWVNGFQENWFLFWLKNLGILLPFGPVCFYLADREHRAAASASLFIFVLGEFILFQPNPYDNNKLFYVAYLLLCLICADGLLTLLQRIRSVALRRSVLVFLLLLTTNAAALTLTREVVSGISPHHYLLFSSNDVAAADYIRDNTEPDALFLTASNHNNTVAVLSGRNILCGSGSYLYYHGLDYRSTEKLEEQMLTDYSVFKENYRDLGIDYVFIGNNERSLGGDTPARLADNYPLVYSNAQVRIYDVREK